MNSNDLTAFVALVSWKQSLERQLKEAKKDIAEMEEKLLPQFEEAGISKMTKDDYTIYIKRNRWPKFREGHDKIELIGALKSAGWDEQVYETYNTQRLAAVLREMQDSGEALPPEVDTCIELSESFNLGTRKA